ncbi:heparinase II/III-family protein [Alcaligenes sp. WGS1538]|uniref:heparinase II/III family protein n=1 Tax=Alcaligenes sp. WGS1538 TaxID=3366811 RepID=UPI00372CF432
MKEDIELCFTGGRLTVRNNADGGQVAYRLYKNNELISKKGYVESGKICTFKIPFTEEAYKLSIYQKKELKVKKFWSNQFRLKDISKALDEAHVEKLDLSHFEIRKVRNVDDEISRYKKVGFIPLGRRDLKPMLLNFPIDWHSDVFKDRNWMFQFHAWRMLEPFFQRFLPEDVEYISEVINDWAAAEAVDEQKTWFWYDMSVGLRAFKLAYFALNCEINKIPHRINDFEGLVKKHIARLSDPSALNKGNHGLFQINGLMSLIWAMRVLCKADFEKEYALNTMISLLREQLGKEGVHTENSPEYHFFVANKITSLLSTPWWKNENLGEINELLRKAEIVKNWLVDPSFRCVPVGDSGSSVVLKDVSSIFDWPHESSTNSIGAALDGYAVVRTRPDIPLDRSHFLFFQASFQSNVHKHADCLSFVLQEKGGNILIDSGKYGYKSDRFRSYFLSSYAHNTVTIDGTSFSKVKRSPYGSALAGGVSHVSGYWIMKGGVEHKELGYSHRRTIVYKPGVDLYVIDLLENHYEENEDRLVELVWNFDSRFFVTSKGGILTGVDDKTHEKFAMDCVAESGEVSFSVHKGEDKDGVLRGWVSPSYLAHEPTPSVIAKTNLQRKQIVVTKFALSNSPARLIDIQEGKVYCADPKISQELSFSVPGLLGWKTKIANHYNNLLYYSYKNIDHYFKKSDSDNLFVSFHGSIKPPTEDSPGSLLPVFRFHDLKVNRQPNLLCFSDLILNFHKKNKVYLGWFLDSEKIKQRDFIEKIISYYVEKYSVKRILFYASSGGGHVALDMASRFNQSVMLSNCQFFLTEHSQFPALERAIVDAADKLMSFDLESTLRGRPGPKECISYCNIDDNTISHHERMEEFLGSYPVHLRKIHFSGEAVAKKNGVGNHSVGFPDGMRARSVIESYYANLK